MDGHSDTADTGNGQNGSSRRTRLLVLGKVLLHLGCLGYSLYLIWLLAYLKENNNYWFLSFIPFYFNLAILFVGCCTGGINFEETSFLALFGVVINLMACFTMLTRQAYYHRQSDEFIGPRFIIMSLQGSIILVLLDFFLYTQGKLDNLLNCKDVLTRMLLDFVDIFNMVEILSINGCVGVGSFVSEESSTEKAIQAFCTMSFMILVRLPPNVEFMTQLNEGNREQRLWQGTPGEKIYYFLISVSALYQNLPFLVIRIVIWAQYKLYSLGFLLKNLTVIILFIQSLLKWRRVPGVDPTIFLELNRLWPK